MRTKTKQIDIEYPLVVQGTAKGDVTVNSVPRHTNVDGSEIENTNVIITEVAGEAAFNIDTFTTLSPSNLGNGDWWPSFISNVPRLNIHINGETYYAALVQNRHWGYVDYDFSRDGGSVGTINLAKSLPDNAAIINAYLRVITPLTSGTSTAQVGIGINTDDVSGIYSPTVITTDLDSVSWVAMIQDGTVANFSELTTDVRTLDFVISIEALTAGKIGLWYEYLTIPV